MYDKKIKTILFLIKPKVKLFTKRVRQKPISKKLFTFTKMVTCWSLFSFSFFLIEFNIWHPFLMMVFFYHQSMTLIDFWCRQVLYLISLIQPFKTLPVELTEIQYLLVILVSLIGLIICAFKKISLVNCTW